MSTEFVQKYSYALYEVAKERNDQNILSHLKEIRENLKDLDLRQFLAHPQIDKEVKKETLGKIFQASLPDYLLNFLYVLVDNKRMGYFDPIYTSFEDLWYEMENIERITVVSAVKLDQDKLEKIARAYKGPDQASVEIQEEVDPSIIGGVILRVGQRVIDQSIRGQLKEMERKLLHSN